MRKPSTAALRLENEDFVADENILVAKNLTLKTLRGCPYSNINLAIKQGQVFAIQGENNSGKTSLLLTLAARMKFSSGSLEILNTSMPQRSGKIQQKVGLGIFKGLNDLPSAQRIDNTIAAELELWGKHTQQDDIEKMLDTWGIAELTHERIGDLTQEQLIYLGIRLAYIGSQKIIVIDDIESDLTQTQSVSIMEQILKLSHTENISIIVGVLEKDLAQMADNALYLNKHKQDMHETTSLASQEVQ